MGRWPSSARLEASPPSVIGGKYRLLRRIAEGGMGTVWLARNLATEAEVALKVVQPAPRDEEHVAARFRHEAKLGATLAHRNITCVYDLLEEESGLLVLVMERLRGETLAERLASEGALPNVEAVAIVVQILSALQHAHDRGVVHRDLKPSNIVLHIDPDGHVTPKLLDFGIAKIQDSKIKTRSGDVLGTPSYMSPEQVRGLSALDGRSDVFAAGVILYELITARAPFEADAAPAVLAKVLEEDIDPDPKIDPRVWLEIQRATSKQAYERHASAKELAAALLAALGVKESDLVASLRVPEERLSEKLAARPSTTDAPPPSMATPIAQISASPPPSSSASKRFLVAGVGVGAALTIGAVVALVAVAPRKSTAMPSAVPAAVEAAPVETTTATTSASAREAARAPVESVSVPRVSTTVATPTSHPKPRPTATSTKPLARTPGF